MSIYGYEAAGRKDKNRTSFTASGAAIGLIGGTALGGLSIPFTLPFKKTYLVIGDRNKWKEFETMITEKKD